MRSAALLILTLIMLSAAGCGNAGKPDRKMRIPENKLVEILTDTYITSGILEIYAMSSSWGRRDSILNYIDVIEKHGFTYDQFDVTMRYYFTGRAGRLARIYDKVIGNLVKMEALNTADKAPEEVTENLWPGKQSYSLPEDFTNDPIWFDIPVKEPGRYRLQADFLLYKDDRSINPRVTLFFSHTGSDGEEVRDYWEEVTLKKDDRVNKVTIAHELDSANGTRLQGWLFNHDSQSGLWEKHALISAISLTLEKNMVE